MVGAQIGDGPNVGVLVLLLGLLIGFVVFFGNVVDMQLVSFAVGFDHRGSFTPTRVALTLHVALFLAIATHDVGIAGPVLRIGAVLAAGAQAGRH